MKKYRHNHIVVFDGDKFTYERKMFAITGVTGVDIDENKIQLRDDLMIKEVGTDYFIGFSNLMKIWEDLEPELIKLVKSKYVIRMK